MTVAPVSAGDEILGCLVAGGDLLGNDGDLRLIERGALVTALVLVRDDAFVAAERRARRELVDALINGTGGRDVLRRRAQAAGLKPSAAHVVVVVRPHDRGDNANAALELAEHSVARFGGLAADRDDDIVVILRGGDHQAVVDWFRARIVDEAAGAATISVSVTAADAGIESLAAAHADARRCLSTMLALGRRGGVASPDDLGPYRFLLAPAGPAEAAEFVERTVGPLLAADLARSSDLALTLETYLATGRHHVMTADQLHIHPNTLYQRLARIGSILGEDWRDPDRALELHLALRLRRLAQALDT
jgi:sugar diacid utilization regulator